MSLLMFVILVRASHALSAFYTCLLSVAHGPADGDGLALADTLSLADSETLSDAEGDKLADGDGDQLADGDRLADETITIPPNPLSPESPLNPGIYNSKC